MGWLDAVTTVATGGLNKALANKTINKAVNKITAPVGKRVGAVATAMRLPSIATNINIKKLLTNPVGYAKGNAAAYAKDATIALSIYTNLKKGNVKGIITQGLADTKAAAKAAKTGVAPAVDWKLDQPVVPAPIPEVPTYNQITGDVPLEPMREPVAAQPTYSEAPTKQSSLKVPMIIIGAVVAVIVLLIVVTR
jgi:hypothetical protein